MELVLKGEGDEDLKGRKENDRGKKLSMERQIERHDGDREKDSK